MNVLDIVLLGLLGVFVVVGLYEGFISALLNLAGFFLSWAMAAILTPHVSSLIMSSSWMSGLMYFADGTQHIRGELLRLPVSQLPPGALDEAIHATQMPDSVAAILHENITNQVFASQGITTLGDYVNLSTALLVVHAISFLLVFVFCAVLCALLVRMCGYSWRYPRLRYVDMPIGGAIGLVRGIFCAFAFFSLVPLVMLLLPVDLFTDLVEHSAFASFFVENNFIFNAFGTF